MTPCSRISLAERARSIARVYSRSIGIVALAKVNEADVDEFV